MHLTPITSQKKIFCSDRACTIRHRAKLSLVLSPRRGRLSISEAGEVETHLTPIAMLSCPLHGERAKNITQEDFI